MIELKQVKKVWSRGAHNAFTDLCWYKGQFWLVFREATAHVSADGIIVVLKSRNGLDWQLAAELRQESVDLRDPKLVITPDQRMLMTVAGVVAEGEGSKIQSYLYFSTDGELWSDYKAVGRVGDWIWRTRFIDGVGYGVSYCHKKEAASLYRLTDNDDFDLYCDPLFSKATHYLGYPNEHDLFELANGQMACLLRRDADSFSAQLGLSAKPYRKWTWYDLDVAIGGPVVLALDGQRFLTVVRLHEPERTSVCELTVEQPAIKELFALPSEGDSSYAGLIKHEGAIWCSYYSSHEGQTSIYIAELRGVL